MSRREREARIEELLKQVQQQRLDPQRGAAWLARNHGTLRPWLVYLFEP